MRHRDQYGVCSGQPGEPNPHLHHEGRVQVHVEEEPEAKIDSHDDKNHFESKSIQDKLKPYPVIVTGVNITAAKLDKQIHVHRLNTDR